MNGMLLRWCFTTCPFPSSKQDAVVIVSARETGDMGKNVLETQYDLPFYEISSTYVLSTI